MLTLQQVLEKTDISRATLYNWKDYGLLPEELFVVERLGKRWKLSVREECVDVIRRIQKMKTEGHKFDHMLAVFAPITLLRLQNVKTPAGYKKMSFLLSEKMFNQFLTVKVTNSANLFTDEEIQQFGKQRIKLSRQSVRTRPLEEGGMEHTIFECGLFEQELFNTIVIPTFVSADVIHHTIDVYYPKDLEVEFRDDYAYLQARYDKLLQKRSKKNQ